MSKYEKRWMIGDYQYVGELTRKDKIQGVLVLLGTVVLLAIAVGILWL